MDRLPKKVDCEVVVARIEPTVSCEVVAMSVVPDELEVTIEFAGKAVALVPPLATDRAPVVVMVGETEPTTVKDEQVRKPEQEALEVETVLTKPLEPT